MIWIVGGCLVLGFGLCGIAFVTNNNGNPDIRSAAPLYMLPGALLISAAVVLALGNAAVKALL